MNQITINPNNEPYYSEEFVKGFNCGAQRQFEADKKSRPQGEWIRTGRTNVYGGIEVQCSNCGDRVMVQHLEDEWFCRHCGADMGMKGADDYERAIEQTEHDMLYEPTYNSEDGSM